MSRLIAAAREIRDDVRSSEDSFDAALANSARLVARLLDARLETGIPPRIGRSALNRALEAVSYGAKARETLLQMHDELSQLNLKELATGDLSDCPKEYFETGLKVVQPTSQRRAA
jgi:hypothetical protein